MNQSTQTDEIVDVIDKMNDELTEVQTENDIFKKQQDEHDIIMKKFQMPRIKVNSLEEYKEFHRKLGGLKNWLGYYEKDAIIQEDDKEYLIKRLNKLTRNKNKEWCEYRIQIAMNTFHCVPYADDDLIDFDFKDLVLGSDSWTQLPEVYRELSQLYIPEWSDRDENHDIENICYYNCETCGKTEDIGIVKDKLYCLKCIMNTTVTET